jgi:hypothetical protein
MPKGAPSKNYQSDLIHFQHIEQRRSLHRAAALSPDTYIDPSKNTVSRAASRRFYYLKNQFVENQENYNRIKHHAIHVITEDNSLPHAKEEQELLDNQLSYCSLLRDKESLSTTSTTFVSPIKKTPPPKKTLPLSIVIPSVNKNPTAAIKMKCTMKNTSKSSLTSVVVL